MAERLAARQEQLYAEGRTLPRPGKLCVFDRSH
jgi:hypothetical protein